MAVIELKAVDHKLELGEMFGILSKSERQGKREFILVKRMNPRIPFEQQQIPKHNKQLLIIAMK
jgi:aspartyl-tRNA synthetase